MSYISKYIILNKLYSIPRPVVSRSKTRTLVLDGDRFLTAANVGLTTAEGSCSISSASCSPISVGKTSIIKT